MLSRSIFVATLLCAPSALAQAQADPLLDMLRADRTMTQFVGDVQTRYQSVARKNPTITQAMLEAREKANHARQRGFVFAVALYNDLNGDLKVTRQEVEEAKLGSPESASALDPMVTFDANHDDVIELHEITAYAKTRQYEPDREGDRFRTLIASDGGADRALDRNEVAAAAERTFKAADVNADGLIDRAEYDAARPRIVPRPRPAPRITP